MTRSRSLVIIAAMLGVLAIPGAGVHAATSPRTAIGSDSWKSAASGVWGLAANWTNGIPTSTDNVYITVPGTYTVTLAPWSIGTADPNQSGATVNSLTLGEASGTGTQTLLIAGQGSRSNSNEQVNTVSLDVAAASTISAHGNLVLDSTNGGLTLPGNPSGGYAGVFGATILNRGSIETETQAPKNKYANFTQFEAPLTNETRASVHDESGLLEATSVTNDGSFIVAPDASLSVVALQGVYAQPASFTNDGQLVNDGAITAAQGAGTVTWTQAGGPIKGNEIVLQNGTTLVDKSGAAQFLINWIAAKISGTIPAGQKITVVGEAYNSNGNNYNGTTLGLVGTVVNDGTIVLDAQGSGKNSGGPAIVTGGSIRNNGTIMAEVQDPSWTVQYQAGLQNTHAARLGITGGTFNDDGAFPATNDGTVEIGPRSLVPSSRRCVVREQRGRHDRDASRERQELRAIPDGLPLLCRVGKVHGRRQPYPQARGPLRAGCQHRVPTVPALGRSLHRRLRPPRQELHRRLRQRVGEPAFVGAIYDKSSKKPKADSLTSRAAVLGGRTGAF